MLLLVLPFSLLFWVLWLYWLQQHDALRERAGLAPLSPSDRSSFALGVFDRRLRGYLLLWPRLLSCVLLELLRFLTYLPCSTFLIAFVLPIAQILLIFFHDTVNSSLPLPYLHPPMPSLIPLFLRLPAFLVDLDCAS